MRRYPVNRLCALAGVTRQAFYKRDEDALLARLAVEQFVVQYVLEVRVKDPKIGMDKLWRMYSGRFPEEYRVGRDVFRKIAGDICRELRASRKAPGYDRIYTAGEREWLVWQERKDKGVPIGESVQVEMIQVRDKLGLPYVFPFEE